MGVRVLACMLMLLVAACSAQTQPAGDVMKAYLEARVAADADALRALSCDANEANIEIEAQSFRGLNVSLVDAVCRETGQGDGFVTVECDGHMAFVYDGEVRERPLGSYQMVQEDGEWKMCGEG